MKKPIARCPHDPQVRRGSIIVLSVIMMMIVLAMCAFAIDLGYICVAKTQLQNTADAAALAGVAELANGRVAVRAAVAEMAANNRAGGRTVKFIDSDIELGTWDKSSLTFVGLTGDAEAKANAVRVTCILSAARNNPLNLFFAPVLGHKTANVTTKATASSGTSRCGLIIGIPSVTMSGSSHTDSYNSDDGPYSQAAAGNGGHVCSNGTITMSGSAKIHGDAHPGPGCVIKSSGSSDVTGEIKPLTKPMSFPPVDPGTASTINNNKKIPKSDFGKTPLSNGDFKLSGADGVTLPPGTYYFSTISISGGSTIRIIGPTIIYITQSCSLSGGTVANHTQLPKNLQLLVSGDSVSISGSSEFYGVVYAPTADVTRSGSADYFGAMVAGKLTLSGSGGIHADDALDFPYLSAGSRKGKLVQ